MVAGNVKCKEEKSNKYAINMSNILKENNIAGPTGAYDNVKGNKNDSKTGEEEQLLVTDIQALSTVKGYMLCNLVCVNQKTEQVCKDKHQVQEMIKSESIENDHNKNMATNVSE
ncbi:hypothetical protein AMTR_s00160p00072570 [Amborella trichopoda]|uniref:Uncharacterized protein n=1 Tax=Amborella trichopoda TaxID=13333 RepID=W1PSH1_AMBTC|nr:hypothetical protein AMTR_s00160p00072570 [Amborella trichopoda]